MRSHFLWTLILLTLLSGSCSSKGHSKLEKALSAAVTDEKLSVRDMDAILEEYVKLRKEDTDKASEFAEQLVMAIEMGADSSHLDAVRKRYVRKTTPKIIV